MDICEHNAEKSTCERCRIKREVTEEFTFNTVNSPGLDRMEDADYPGTDLRTDEKKLNYCRHIINTPDHVVKGKGEWYYIGQLREVAKFLYDTVEYLK